MFDFGGGGVAGMSLEDTPGPKWYVDPNKGSSGSGKSWSRAFRTITEALAVIARAGTKYPSVFLAPGDYDEGTTINLSIQGTRLIAPLNNRYQNKAMLMDGAQSGYDLLTINNHECVVDGLALSAAVDTYDGVVIGGTAPAYKVLIQNCRLDGWSGEYGVQAGAVNDCPDLAILNCLFRSWNTAACQLNVTRGHFIGNLVHVVTDKIGLEHIPAGGDRPDNVYINNRFSAVANASTTGIKFTGAPNNGTIMVGDNRFYGTFDTTITKIAAYAGVLNYVSDNAGGNTLVDTVT